MEGPHKNSQRSHIPITFDSNDLKLQDYPHTDAMMIKTNIARWIVTKILVDTRSSADILFALTFDNMQQHFLEAAKLFVDVVILATSICSSLEINDAVVSRNRFLEISQILAISRNRFQEFQK
jgi:hypothetical protein